MSPLYILKTISYLSVWEYMKKMNNETLIRENHGRDRCVGFNRICKDISVVKCEKMNIYHSQQTLVFFECCNTGNNSHNKHQDSNSYDDGCWD